VHPVAANRLLAEAMYDRNALARDGLLAGEQIVMRLNLLLEDQALEVEPEPRLRDGRWRILPPLVCLR
jgi:hypothetical protein